MNSNKKKPSNTPAFDKLKYENLQNALYAYDTFLAYTKTDAEWNTVMRLHNRIRDDHAKMTLEKNDGDPEEIKAISARELGETPDNEL